MGCQLCNREEQDNVVLSIETETELKTDTKASKKNQKTIQADRGLQRKVKSFVQKNFYENMNLIPRSTECILESELKEIYSVRENSIGGELKTAAVFFLIDSSLLKSSKIIIQNSLMAIFFDFKRYFSSIYNEAAGEKIVFYKFLYDSKQVFKPIRYPEFTSFNPYLKAEELCKLESVGGGTFHAINQVCEIYEAKEKDLFESVFLFHYHNSDKDDELTQEDLNLRNIDSLKYELILFGEGEKFLQNLDQEINYDVVKVFST